MVAIVRVNLSRTLSIYMSGLAVPTVNFQQQGRYRNGGGYVAANLPSGVSQCQDVKVSDGTTEAAIRAVPH
jgi:hypothetical protein